MSRMKLAAAGDTEMDRIWGLRPQFYEAYMRDVSSSMALSEPCLIELCRLRMAQVHNDVFSQGLRYRPARDAGLTEEKIAKISRYGDDDQFSDRERAAMEFAEHLVLDYSSIGDAEIARLGNALGEEEMIYLIKGVNVLDQLQRNSVALRLPREEKVPKHMPDFTTAPRESAL